MNALAHLRTQYARTSTPTHFHTPQHRGFGHVGFLVDDLDKACAELEKKGARFKKKPQDGSMRGLAFVYDDDGYWVELIQRNGIKM